MTGYLRLLIVFCALALSFGTIQAQNSLPDSTITPLTALNTIEIYHNFMGDESRLFNGIEHYGYLSLQSGHPYFLQDSMEKGTLIYENCWYRNIPLLYDLVRDVIVIASPNGDVMTLAGEKISEFYLLGHHFVNTPVGYCDLLVTGSLTLEVRRVKTILETIEGQQVVRNIEYKDNYYVLLGGVRYPAGNLHALLSLVKDKKKAINQDLRKKKIKFRKQPEQAMLEAVTYYNQSLLQ